MGNKDSKESPSSSSTSSNSSNSSQLDKLASETKMSKQEIHDLLEIFKKIADKNGLVGKEQLREAVKKKYGADNSSTLVYSILNVFDHDKSKAIDFREFVLALSHLSNPSLDDVIDITFRCIDLNGDGSITKGELREVMLMNSKLKKYVEVFRRNGSLDQITLSPTEISNSNYEADLIFEEIDMDKSKQITFEEFKSVISKDEDLKNRISNLLMVNETKSLFKK